MSYQIHVLQNGYSIDEGNHMRANCTCTLIKGPKNIIVDTMTPWDKDILINGLTEHGLSPKDIHFVICTHGHSDHIGNNNLFLEAKHIVGFCVSFKDQYDYFPFNEGREFIIDEHVKIIPTPGHTLQDVTVLVQIGNETTAMTGDLFEKEEDIRNPEIWLSAGSDSAKLQKLNRKQIIEQCSTIIPGHGPKFHVTEEYRQIVTKQNKMTEEGNIIKQ